MVDIAIVGLDTSHATEFTMRLQSPDCPPDQRVGGARVVSCLRFPTRFMDDEGLDKRQQQMEEWGVNVTTDFEEATADCDAIALEINDPSHHLDYFTRCAGLGKPIFLDKPMADSFESARAIQDIMVAHGLRVMSASSLRFVPQLEHACRLMPLPRFGNTYGPLGKAPAGSSIVWYGVHAFEMLQRIMGRGACSVQTINGPNGVVSVVEYDDFRRGMVELSYDAFIYGGCLRSNNEAFPFVVDFGRAYSDLLARVVQFLSGGETSVEIMDTLEIMAMLDAAQRSSDSGRVEELHKED